MSFVLDCSVTMAWCFEDEGTDFSDHVLESLQERVAVVPDVLWELEVWNALLVAVRRGRFDEGELDEQLGFFDALPIKTIRPPIPMARALAREHQLSSYDGAYLALAMDEGLPVATMDNGLQRAAKEAGVPLLNEQ